MKNYNVVTSKSGRVLTGKNVVFWIGGRLREVVAHGGSTVDYLID